MGRLSAAQPFFPAIPLIPCAVIADNMNMSRHCSMKNQRMLAEAFKSLDGEMDELYRMASQIFRPRHTSPLGWLLDILRSPFRR